MTKKLIEPIVPEFRDKINIFLKNYHLLIEQEDYLILSYEVSASIKVEYKSFSQTTSDVKHRLIPSYFIVTMTREPGEELEAVTKLSNMGCPIFRIEKEWLFEPDHVLEDYLNIFVANQRRKLIFND